MSHRSALGRGSPLGSVLALPLWTRWPQAHHFASMPRSRLNRDTGGIELMYREPLEQLLARGVLSASPPCSGGSQEAWRSRAAFRTAWGGARACRDSRRKLGTGRVARAAKVTRGLSCLRVCTSRQNWVYIFKSQELVGENLGFVSSGSYRPCI